MERQEWFYDEAPPSYEEAIQPSAPPSQPHAALHNPPALDPIERNYTHAQASFPGQQPTNTNETVAGPLASYHLPNSALQNSAVNQPSSSSDQGASVDQRGSIPAAANCPSYYSSPPQGVLQNHNHPTQYFQVGQPSWPSHSTNPRANELNYSYTNTSFFGYGKAKPKAPNPGQQLPKNTNSTATGPLAGYRLPNAALPNSVVMKNNQSSSSSDQGANVDGGSIPAEANNQYPTRTSRKSNNSSSNTGVSQRQNQPSLQSL